MVGSTLLRRFAFPLVLEAAGLAQLPASPSVPLPPPIITIELKKDRTVVSSVPSFGYFGPVKCDGDGNIYFRLSEKGLNHSPIVKLSPKGEKKASS